MDFQMRDCVFFSTPVQSSLYFLALREARRVNVWSNVPFFFSDCFDMDDAKILADVEQKKRKSQYLVSHVFVYEL